MFDTDHFFTTFIYNLRSNLIMKKTTFVLLPLAALISGIAVADDNSNLDAIEVVSDNLSP